MIEPHGGKLVNRMFPDQSDTQSNNQPSIEISPPILQDLLNIASGRYSPVSGFFTQNDFLKVAHDMTLEDGTVWPLPIILAVGSEKAAELEPTQRANLKRPNGEIIGEITVEEVYRYNKEEIAEAIFGTKDPSHPGVSGFLQKEDFLVGGPISLFSGGRYNTHDLQPRESRVLFQRIDWDTVVGFQTRNAPHRAHEYIQKSALEFTDGLLIQPKLGNKKSGDYRDDIILETYEKLIEEYYPSKTVVLSVFPSRMRYAGPREAVFDAIVRKNQGCSHFIIGRDHAGVADYYDGFDAHRLFDQLGDIGIQPLFFSYSFYCKICDGMASEKICPHSDDDRVYPSGTEIRETVQRGEHPSEHVMRPEVANFIVDADEPFVN